MDPFEVRMQFLTLLRRLNASQQSIQKVVTFAVRHFPGCGEDLWDCIVEECQKGTINARINILYFLDSLCEKCLLVKSHAGAAATNNQYVDYVSRDLSKIVTYVVPKGRSGLPNLSSTKQILENWRTKRVIDPQKIDDVTATLLARTTITTENPSASTAAPTSSSSRSNHSSNSLSRNEVFKRIEEDRERHKRLRERRWVQPISHNPNTTVAATMAQLTTFMPFTDTADGEQELSIDIEFDNEWETTSDWNEDDVEAAAEENELCFPAEGEGPMDLS